METKFRIIRFGLVKMGQIFRFDKRWWMNDYNNPEAGIEVNEKGELENPNRRLMRYFDFHRTKVGIKT